MQPDKSNVARLIVDDRTGVVHVQRERNIPVCTSREIWMTRAPQPDETAPTCRRCIATTGTGGAMSTDLQQIPPVQAAALVEELRDLRERVADNAACLRALGRERSSLPFGAPDAASTGEPYPPDTPEANARARAEGQTIALDPTGGEDA